MINTEMITLNEGINFSTSDSDTEKELLSILAVHPMRKDAVEEYITKSNSDWSLIINLVCKNKIKEVFYNHNSYYAMVY
jgi:hypothetical protein